MLSGLDHFLRNHQVVALRTLQIIHHDIDIVDVAVTQEADHAVDLPLDIDIIENDFNEIKKMFRIP